MAIATGELCDRYERLYPGAVADSLDAFGYTRRVFPSEINPLTRDMQLAGIAYPVLGRTDRSVDYDTNIRRILEMLGDAPNQGVMVTESQDDVAAHLGELSTAALQQRGCRGAVLDGGIRDVRYILDQDFPVFTRYRTPADAPPRWRLVDWDVPVTIGDVEVRPGDVIVGDVDGIVCVPRGVREQVLEAAEDTVEAENKVREAVGEGVDPLDAYEKYGKF